MRVPLGEDPSAARMVRRCSATLCVVYLLLPAFCLEASADQWRGWRGLDHDGRSESKEGPEEWSADRNVRWRISLPGEGLSSPVVSEDAVFLTTARFTEFDKGFKQAAVYAVLGLGLLLALATIPFIIRCCRAQARLTWGQFLSVLCYCLLIGLLVHSLFVGHLPSGDAHSDYFCRWFHSSAIVMLCLTLVAFQLSPSSFLRFFLGITAIGFAGFVLLGRPNPEYYELLGFTGGHFTFMFFPFTGLLGTGIVLLVGTFLTRKQELIPAESPQREPSKKLFWMGLILAGGALGLGLAGLGAMRFLGLHAYYYFKFNLMCFTFAGLLVTGIVLLLAALLRRTQQLTQPESPPHALLRELFWMRLTLAGGALVLGLAGLGAMQLLGIARVFARLLGSGSFTLPADLTSTQDRLVFLLGPHFSYPWFLLVASAGFLVWLIVEVGNLRPGRMRLPWWLPIGFLCLGALNFWETNYVKAQTQFVRAIVCLDRNTGTVKWTREGLPGPREIVSRQNSAATPTPVIDAHRVYACFGSPGLMCTDHDGTLLWTNTDLPFEGIHGIGASPIPSDGLLIVMNAMAKAPYLTALDCNTGKRAWTTKLRPWEGTHGRHRTPLVVSLNAKNVIVDLGNQNRELAAYDVRSGELLWSHSLKYPGGAREDVAGVICDGDTLYLPGKVNVQAVSLSALAEGKDPLLWKTNVRGKGPVTASPLLCSSMLFIVSDVGHASCLDAATGNILWSERLAGDEHLSSPVVAGDRIYFCSTSGVTTVVACEPEFRKIAENTLPGSISATPAPVDGQLFIRTTECVCCIEHP